jgi:hypothetical protein
MDALRTVMEQQFRSMRNELEARIDAVSDINPPW